jgi:hypothetical protein
MSKSITQSHTDSSESEKDYWTGEEGEDEADYFSYDDEEIEQETEGMGISAVCQRYKSKEERCARRKAKKKAEKASATVRQTMLRNNITN